VAAIAGGGSRGPGTAARLALWMALTVALQGALWTTGFKTAAMTEAIERGAARAETLRMAEVGDDLVRKAVRSQEATRPFWTTLGLLGDFVVEPLALPLRALAVATLLAGLAALLGRPPDFARALAEDADLQGIWVLGLATRAALSIALRRPGSDTSLTLAFSPGTYPAPFWVALHQFDAFALLGWALLARGAWGRGQANLAVASFVCAGLFCAESAARIVLTLIFEGGMRLSLIPE